MFTTAQCLGMRMADYEATRCRRDCDNARASISINTYNEGLTNKK